MPQSPAGKVSTRRGSVSAPDPLGKNAALNYDPNRSSSSILTIVRVVDSASSSGAVLNLSDSPSSPTHSRRSLRRRGSISTSPSTDSNRLSFAFSSFSPISPTLPSSPLSSSGPQNYPARAGSSPSSSPRLRPSSPQFVRRNSASGGSGFTKPNLTPEQLVDLARQSSAPRYASGSSLALHTSNPNKMDTMFPSVSSPAKFTILPLDVYLPFIDRAVETAHMLSNPPTKKLFSLLAQTFPTQAPHEEIQDPFVTDPAQWTFNTLRRWLTEVDRSSVDDALWVRQARKCVLSHSELIWERMKGALGVPPELELEDIDVCYSSRAVPLLPTSEDEPNPSLADRSRQSMDPIALTSSPDQSLIMEPILVTSSLHPYPSSPGISNPPPSSLPASLSQSASSKVQVDQVLQDIVEDREEEEGPDVNTCGGDRSESEDDSRTQIHGIRVCTLPVSPSVTPHIFSYPPSPDLNTNMDGKDSVEPRSPEFSQPPISRRFSSGSSHGSIVSTRHPVSGSYTRRHLGFGATPEIEDNESERAYDPVGDRVPGNPLFPSNFARLALGPTLRANNPSLRSQNATTPRWAHWRPGSRPPSWVEHWDAIKQEYATTAASGSSIGTGD